MLSTLSVIFILLIASNAYFINEAHKENFA